MSIPGTEALVQLPSGKKYMMVRGETVWGFLLPSAEDQAYVAANPMPPPIPAQVTGVVATPGDTIVGLAWNAVSGALEYRIYCAVNGGVEALVSTVSGVAYNHTGLTNGATNVYRVAAANAAGEGTKSATVSVVVGMKILHKSATIPALFLAGEVMAPGVLPFEGALDAAGTTFHFYGKHWSTTVLPVIYGVRAALLNQRGVPISGGAMVFSTLAAAQWAGAITGNPTTGWQSLTVGGDAALPVPAASADAEGMAWAEAIFPAGIPMPATWYARFFHPGQAEASDYSLGYAYSAVVATVGVGVLTANVLLQKDMREWQNTPKIYRAAGRAIETPSAISQATFELAKSPDGSYLCEAPGPCSLPFIQLQFLTEAP